MLAWRPTAIALRTLDASARQTGTRGGWRTGTFFANVGYTSCPNSVVDAISENIQPVRQALDQGSGF